MIAVLKPITQRPVQRPNYARGEDFAHWLRLNHMLCWDYWSEVDEEDPERAGAWADFHDFAKVQYDLHCASLEDDQDEPTRQFRTADDAAAYEAGVPARGEF